MATNQAGAQDSDGDLPELDKDKKFTLWWSWRLFWFTVGIDHHARSFTKTAEITVSILGTVFVEEHHFVHLCLVQD